MWHSREHGRRPNDYEYSRNQSEYRSRVQESEIKDLKAELTSARNEIRYRVQANHSLKQEIEYVTSESTKEIEKLKRIIENLQIELSATKDNLKSQHKANADLKRKLGDESSKNDGRLKNLEEELNAKKMELKEQVFSNSLVAAETTSLKDQMKTLNVENANLKKQNDSQTGQIHELKQKIKAGRCEITGLEMKCQSLLKLFEELENINKINDNVMKSIKSTFSSHRQTEINVYHNNGQVADNIGSTLDSKASGIERDFACNKCSKYCQV